MVKEMMFPATSHSNYPSVYANQDLTRINLRKNRSRILLYKDLVWKICLFRNNEFSSYFLLRPFI